MRQDLENYRQIMDSKDMGTKKIFGEIEEIEDEIERQFNRFKNFDRVSSPPCDHHFLNYSNYSLRKIVSGSGFRQRIEQEWALLEKNMPNSIFVRAYEQRIDLMRAAIMGPPGTPYQHCLFFFDVFFPRNYPSGPPKLHYHSYQLDLNQNLQSDGRVRLALLETWYDRFMQRWNGRGSKEKWNSKESNLLHVLNAISDLIVSSEPHAPESSRLSLYANPERLKNHNKRALMLTCKKVIRIVRGPPMGFEVFVAGHFRNRAHPILLKFKENEHDSKPPAIHLFVSLFKVLESTGAYCKHHLDFLRSRKQQISTVDVEAIIRHLEERKLGEGEPSMVNFDYVDSIGKSPTLFRTS